MSFETSSRFSVLQLVNDNNRKKTKKPRESVPVTEKPCQQKKPKEKRALMPAETQKPKTQEPPKDQAKKQKQQEKKQKKKEEFVTEKQWSSWQARDSELVDDLYEKDLKEALLQSKIDYEKDRHKKEDSAPVEDCAARKTKKNKKISLQEFLASSDGQKPTENEKSFTFEEIEHQVKQILRKEQYRMMGCTSTGRDTVLKIDDTPETDPADEEAKDHLIQSLRATNARLTREVSEWQMKYEGATKLLEEQRKLLSVQLANPTTESLLKSIDELQRQQVELYNEIGNLHVMLEQERSRNQGESAKIKNGGGGNVKKSVRFSAA
ncbi:G kinase-anchoring protein 1 [Sergentomyia squamirostris]